MHAPDFGGKPYEGVISQGFPPQPNNQTLECSLEGCQVPMVIGTSLIEGRWSLLCNNAV